MDKKQLTTWAGPCCAQPKLLHGLANGVVARSRKADSYNQHDLVIECK
jgi:hypothetical protein